jgi:hypothetical protein
MKKLIATFCFWLCCFGGTPHAEDVDFKTLAERFKNLKAGEDIDLSDLFGETEWHAITPHVHKCSGSSCEENLRSAFKFDGPIIKIRRSEHSKLYYRARAYLSNCYMHPTAQKDLSEILDRVLPQLEINIIDRARGEAWLRLDGSVTCERANEYNSLFRTLDRSYR